MGLVPCPPLSLALRLQTLPLLLPLLMPLLFLPLYISWLPRGPGTPAVVFVPGGVHCCSDFARRVTLARQHCYE